MADLKPAWHVRVGDIFDVEAEALVCSANVFLTLSGGVGGELFRRFGDAVQAPLADYLSRNQLRHVPRGTVLGFLGVGTPYDLVIHAVAVDGLYESSVEVVADVLRQCVRMAVEARVRSVVMPALATGYGRLQMRDFFAAVVRVSVEVFDVDSITIVVKDAIDAKSLEDVMR